MQNSGGSLGNTGFIFLTGYDSTGSSLCRAFAIYTCNKSNVYNANAPIVTLRSYISDTTFLLIAASSRHEKVDLGECGDLINCFSKKTVRKFHFKSDK